MKKNNQGITLIALVITIIVLLILAGVSIAMLTGQNGILTQAQNSKLVTTQAKVNEMTELAIGSLRTENLNDTSKITPQLVASQINKENNRTDVTASSTTFPSDMIFADEGMKSTVNIDLTVGKQNSNDNNNNNTSSLYPENIDESKIAPEELFDFEPITESVATSKVASTDENANLPQKEARITGIKTKYCTAEETNYKINYTGITDTLVIPYQVKIGEEMYKVTEVNLYVKGIEHLEYIQPSNLPDIQNIIYPNTVKTLKITDGADVWNKNIERVVLSKNITEIPENYFSNGSKIKEIELPSNLEKIGKSSFFYCEALESIMIPDNVKTIEKMAFYQCTTLSSITLPSNIQNLEEAAFYWCTNLSSVTYKGATYTSKSELESALKTNGVTIGNSAFDYTKLTN